MGDIFVKLSLLCEDNVEGFTDTHGSLKNIYGKSNDVLKQVTESSGVNFDINEAILRLEKEMLEAAEKLEFERAAFLRDKVKKIKEKYD